MAIRDQWIDGIPGAGRALTPQALFVAAVVSLLINTILVGTSRRAGHRGGADALDRRALRDLDRFKEINDTLQHADHAMYLAKHRGTSSELYSSERSSGWVTRFDNP